MANPSLTKGIKNLEGYLAVRATGNETKGVERAIEILKDLKNSKG